MEHLWTRQRVEAEVALRGPAVNGASTTTMFNNGMMRIFATQEKLFSFLEEEQRRLGGLDKWIPFSIEFVSEYDLEEMREEQRRKDLGLGIGTTSATTVSAAANQLGSKSGQLTSFFTRAAQDQTEAVTTFEKKKGPLEKLFAAASAASASSVVTMTAAGGGSRPALGEKRGRDGAISPPPAQPSNNNTGGNARRVVEDNDSPVPRPPPRAGGSSPPPAPTRLVGAPVPFGGATPKRRSTLLFVHESGPSAKEVAAAKEREARAAAVGATAMDRSVSPALSGFRNGDEGSAAPADGDGGAPQSILTSSGAFVLNSGGAPARQASKQTKFFTAMTREGLERYLAVVPYPQQHLFELILLTNNSRVYLDIERDADQCEHDVARMRELLCGAVTTTTETSTTSKAERGGDELKYYASYLRELGSTRHATCPIGCDHCVPSRDIDFVVEVLIKYWRRFLAEKRPELGLADCLPSGIGDEGALDSDGESGVVSLMLTASPAERAARRLMREQITVLQSVPLKPREGGGEKGGGGGAAAASAPTNKEKKLAKFSIHLVFKFLEDEKAAKERAEAAAGNNERDDGGDDAEELLVTPSRKPRHTYQPPPPSVVEAMNVLAGGDAQRWAKKGGRGGGGPRAEVVLNSNASTGDLVQSFVAFLYDELTLMQRRLVIDAVERLGGHVPENVRQMAAGAEDDWEKGQYSNNDGGAAPSFSPSVAVGSGEGGDDAQLAPLRRRYHELHTALFYHSDAGDRMQLRRPWAAADATGGVVDEAAADRSLSPATARSGDHHHHHPAGTAPRLHLRCIIDTAVYSKNRMMRCMGSSKLGKDAVLLPYQSPRVGASAATGDGGGGNAPWWASARLARAAGRTFRLHSDANNGDSGVADAEALRVVRDANNTSPSSFDVQQQSAALPRVGDCLPPALGAAFFGTMVSLHDASAKEKVRRIAAAEQDLAELEAEKRGALRRGVGSWSATDGRAPQLQQQTLRAALRRQQVQHESAHRSSFLTAEESLWAGGAAGGGGAFGFSGGSSFDTDDAMVGGFGFESNTLDVGVGFSTPSAGPAATGDNRTLLCDAHPVGRTVTIVPDGVSLAEWGRKARVPAAFLAGGARTHPHAQRATSISSFQRDCVTVQRTGETSLPALNSFILKVLAAPPQGGSTLSSGYASRRGAVGGTPRIYKHILYFRDNGCLPEDPRGVAAGRGSHLSAILIIVTDFRYCRAAKRAHKSNDVYYTLFLDWAVMTAEVPSGLADLRPLLKAAVQPNAPVAKPRRTPLFFGGPKTMDTTAETLETSRLIVGGARVSERPIGNDAALDRFNELASLSQHAKAPASTSSIVEMLRRAQHLASSTASQEQHGGRATTCRREGNADPAPSATQMRSGISPTQLSPEDDPFAATPGRHVHELSDSDEQRSTQTSPCRASGKCPPSLPKMEQKASPKMNVRIKSNGNKLLGEIKPPPAQIDAQAANAPTQAHPEPTAPAPGAAAREPMPGAQMHFGVSSSGEMCLAHATGYSVNSELALLGVRCFQKCFDPDCNQTQGAQRSYRSEQLSLDVDVQTSLGVWAKSLSAARSAGE